MKKQMRKKKEEVKKRYDHVLITITIKSASIKGAHKNKQRALSHMILTTLRSSLTFSLISAASLSAASLSAAMMALTFLGSSGSNKPLYLGCCAGAFLFGFVSSNKALYLGCCVHLHFPCNPTHQGYGIFKPTKCACIEFH